MVKEAKKEEIKKEEVDIKGSDGCEIVLSNWYICKNEKAVDVAYNGTVFTIKPGHIFNINSTPLELFVNANVPVKRLKSLTLVTIGAITKYNYEED